MKNDERRKKKEERRKEKERKRERENSSSSSTPPRSEVDAIGHWPDREAATAPGSQEYFSWSRVNLASLLYQHTVQSVSIRYKEYIDFKVVSRGAPLLIRYIGGS
jgi:hypothetical protein